VAISVLDVRDTLVPPRVRLPEPALRPLPERPGGLECTAVATTLRRPPAPVVVAALGGVVQALALVAAALTVLAGRLDSADRPSGVVVATGLVLLAGWVVLAATSGAALLDGTGRRLYAGLAWIELALVLAVLVAVTVTPLLDGVRIGFPVPALALFLLAVPAGKLLLSGATSTSVWLAQGPRVRERRPDPTRSHRGLCVATLGLIALTLTAAALLVPAPGHGGPTTPASVSSH
jgi:hypothetical protein